jgi:hypothetical protein
MNDVGLIERNQSALAFDDVDVWICREIDFGARCEFWRIFYSGDLP